MLSEIKRSINHQKKSYLLGQIKLPVVSSTFNIRSLFPVRPSLSQSQAVVPDSSTSPVYNLETLISFCQYFCSPWCLKIYLLLPPHYSSVKIAWLGWRRKMAVPISSRWRKNSVLNWYFRAKYINTQTKCIIYLKSKLVFILRDVHDTSVGNASCQCHPHLCSSGTPTQLLSCLDNNLICDGWKQKVMHWRWLLVCLLQKISSPSTSV